MINRALQSAIRTIAVRSCLLVASDYDGVLSPLVPDPAAAVPDTEALQALVELGKRSNTYAATVSGRSLATLRELTGAPEGVLLIGTHGAEESGAALSDDLADRVAGLQTALSELAKQYPGSLVEAKPIGAAFHYRHVSRPADAAHAVQAAAAAAGARTIAGKMVVECLFGDANKGTAIARLRERIGADAVFFMGDDTTDEDVFALLGEGDVGVKVGPGDTAARYRVTSQDDVAPVLRLLLAERS